MVKYIVIRIPTFGWPAFYESDNHPHIDEIKRVVQGQFREIPPHTLLIHPLFYEKGDEDPGAGAWLCIDKLMKSRDYKNELWINEDGYEKCMPNMAIINRLGGGNPYIHGECLYVVYKSRMTKYCGKDWSKHIRRCENLDELLNDDYMEE